MTIVVHLTPMDLLTNFAAVFNENFSKESAAAINQLGNMVSDLSSKAKKLTLTDMHSVFNDRSAISSDSNVLTASAYDALSQNTGAAERDCLNDTSIKRGLSKKNYAHRRNISVEKRFSGR